MWSSSPFIPPPPLSCGAWVPGSEAVLEYGVTEATLAATGDTSTADTTLFADSRFRQGSAFRRGPETGHGLRHPGLELVGVPGAAAEGERREDARGAGQPARHRSPVHDPGRGTLGAGRRQL